MSSTALQSLASFPPPSSPTPKATPPKASTARYEEKLGFALTLFFFLCLAAIIIGSIGMNTNWHRTANWILVGGLVNLFFVGPITATIADHLLYKSRKVTS